jgi:hypothetical protein
MKNTIQKLAESILCGLILGAGPLLYAFGYIGG